MTMTGQLATPAIREESNCLGSSWYLCRKLIEDQSPSRKDGIDLKKETQLRNLYCSFLQDVGKKLKLPQVTIAVAVMICHRFYLRQSHAKNEWQTVATASMFLASKVEETPRSLMDVVVVAYETMYRRDPVSAQRIKNKDVSEKQKDLILTAERLVLSTISFDFNIQLPYKPLAAAFKKFKITSDVCKLAWNFLNDWLRTTLCLQYKPHYIAAGSLFLAAKCCHVKLPSERGMVWWHEFDVTPRQLEEVIKQMQDFLEQNKKAMAPPPLGKVSQIPAGAEKEASAGAEKEASCSPESCVLDVAATTSNHPIDKGPGQVNPASAVVCHDPGAQDCSNNDICVIGDGDLQCRISDCESTRSTIEDSERIDEGMGQARIKANCSAGIDILSVSKGLSDLDKDRIRSKLKRKRWERDTFDKEVEAIDDVIDDDAWIERELEDGIVIRVEYGEQQQRQI